MSFNPDSLQKAELWLEMKGWQDAGFVVLGKYWRQPNDTQVYSTITAVGLQVLKDWWG